MFTLCSICATMSCDGGGDFGGGDFGGGVLASYPLFAHALNFPTFREFRIIPCYLRVP